MSYDDESYEEGEGYVASPSPIEYDRAVAVFAMALFVILALTFSAGYCTGHTAATAAIHKEAE